MVFDVIGCVYPKNRNYQNVLVEKDTPQPTG